MVPAGTPMSGFVSVSGRERPVHPLPVAVSLVSFPAMLLPFINLGNARNAWSNISALIHAAVIPRAEKPIQTHSAPLAVNVRVYTHAQVVLMSVATEDQNHQAASFCAR